MDNFNLFVKDLVNGDLTSHLIIGEIRVSVLFPTGTNYLVSIIRQRHNLEPVGNPIEVKEGEQVIGYMLTYSNKEALSKVQ